MSRNGILPAGIVLVVLVLSLHCFPAAVSAAPCFSQLQVLGTHNSYHAVPPKPIRDLLSSPLAKAVLPPTAFLPQSWEYQQPPLSDQLAAGIRAFEFDIHPDPAGGLYSTPAMLKFAGVDPKSSDPTLLQPGYKVLHVPDIDISTTCTTFVACLTAIKQWSDANPTHVPITITVQTSFGETDLVALIGDAGKIYIEDTLAASSIPGPTKLVTQPAASKDLLGSIESEILSVFPIDNIITPDSVRKALNLSPSADLTKTLLQAPTPTTCPWPDLESLRGKVIFGFIFPDQATADLYKNLHPGQIGAVGWMVWDSFYIPEAVMYTAGGGLNLSLDGGVTPPALPKNASAIVANLAKDISDKVASGYLVRARADADTIEARLGYVGRAAAVLNSSANIVASDYAMPTSIIPGINYSVKLYGNQPARCVNNAALGTYTGPEVSCTKSTTPIAVPLTSTTSASSGGAAAVDGGNPTSTNLLQTDSTISPVSTTSGPSGSSPAPSSSGSSSAATSSPTSNNSSSSSVSGSPPSAASNAGRAVSRFLVALPMVVGVVAVGLL